MSVFVLYFLILISLSGCHKPHFHSIQFQVSGEGEMLPLPGSYQLEGDSVFFIKAQAGAGWEFYKWEGPVKDPEKRSTSFLVQQDQIITAVFVEKQPHQVKKTGTMVCREEFLPFITLSFLGKEEGVFPVRLDLGWDPVAKIFSFWLHHIRSFKSPYLYWFFRETLYRGDLPEKWIHVRDLNKYDFAAVLQNYPFRMDLAGGLFDFSPQEEDFFFLSRERNRDCDNWSRMWFYWAQYHNYPVWEIAIINGWDITSAHMITVFQDRDGYNLCNYTIVDQYSSLEEAVEVFQEKRLTASGPYPHLRWVIYQKSIPP